MLVQRKAILAIVDGNGGIVDILQVSVLQRLINMASHEPSKRSLLRVVQKTHQQAILKKISDSDTVSRLRKWLSRAAKAGRSELVLDCLRCLRRLPITVAILSETQIGKSVRSLIRKFPDSDVSTRASDIIEYWRQVLKKHQEAMARQQQKELEEAAKVELESSGTKRSAAEEDVATTSPSESGPSSFDAEASDRVPLKKPKLAGKPLVLPAGSPKVQTMIVDVSEDEMKVAASDAPAAESQSSAVASGPTPASPTVGTGTSRPAPSFSIKLERGLPSASAARGLVSGSSRSMPAGPGSSRLPPASGLTPDRFQQRSGAASESSSKTDVAGSKGAGGGAPSQDIRSRLMAERASTSSGTVTSSSRTSADSSRPSKPSFFEEKSRQWQEQIKSRRQALETGQVDSEITARREELRKEQESRPEGSKLYRTPSSVTVDEMIRIRSAEKPRRKVSWAPADKLEMVKVFAKEPEYNPPGAENPSQESWNAQMQHRGGMTPAEWERRLERNARDQEVRKHKQALREMESRVSWRRPKLFWIPPQEREEFIIARGEDSVEKTAQMSRESTQLVYHYINDKMAPENPSDPPEDPDPVDDAKVQQVPFGASTRPQESSEGG